MLLVPLYLTVLDPPLIGQSLLNTVWALVLPGAVPIFNVILIMNLNLFCISYISYG